METIQHREAYTRILREEIVLASGCPEPISVAYCAAKAHQVLGMQPTGVTVSVSENILKNIRSVTVPHTHGLKGIRAAAALGIIAGDADKGMQVVDCVSDEQRVAVGAFLETVNIDVSCAETNCTFYISITLYARTSYSRVVIANGPFNIVEVMKNGEAIVKRPIVAPSADISLDRSCLNFHDIFLYADRIDLAEIRELLDRQMQFNTAIANEGLTAGPKSSVGRTLHSLNMSDPKSLSAAQASAGCAARINGSELPVATLCGSGNQGIIAAVPLICYCSAYAVEAERLYRALALSDLLTVYLNAAFAQRSSECSAGYAGCAAGAGVAYLTGADEAATAQVLNNAVLQMPRILCSGMRASCPVAVSCAVNAGLITYHQLLIQQRNGEFVCAPQNPDVLIRSIARSRSDGNPDIK